jgi:trans-2,3-dihydro-3-hydroxyanthranilate isomerase
MEYRFHTADVFTDRTFGGNQLAVLPDARGLSDAQMASITREFNLSETVFVFPPENSLNTRRIRIFTPGSELPFAGHPTVGCAFVLAVTGEIPVTAGDTRIVLEEGVGPVPVLIRARDGKPVFTQLTAAKIPEKGDYEYDVEQIAAMVSLDPSDIDAENGNAIEAWSAGVPFVFIPLRSLDALGRARISLEHWEKTLRDSWATEPFLFVEENGAYRARMFAPNLGIPEDPATGGACAAFAGYIAARAGTADGTLRQTVHQGVEMGRPSRIEVEVDIAGGSVRAVRVGGASVLVSSGTLFVP